MTKRWRYTTEQNANILRFDWRRELLTLEKSNDDEEPFEVYFHDETGNEVKNYQGFQSLLTATDFFLRECEKQR